LQNFFWQHKSPNLDPGVKSPKVDRLSEINELLGGHSSESKHNFLNKNRKASSSIEASESSKNVVRNPWYTRVQEKQIVQGLNAAETALFLGLATANYVKDKRDLHTNLDLAVAAERGLVSEEIEDWHLRASKNPIIQSVMDRHKWQYRLRFGSAPWFSIGLPFGILANAFVITAERTVFYRPLAYDLLKRAVTDVQINNMDSGLTQARLSDDLVKVLQQERMDHRQPTLTNEQIKGIRPTIDLIAKDIIDKRFGFAGAIYIMGGGVIVPEDPQQTRLNYEHVRQVGVSGIAREARDIQERLKVGPSRVWQAHIAAQRDAAQEADTRIIAGSATREALLRQKGELLARGPVHGGAVPEGRRGSAGMAI
jgi:hypothetical protein